jgi:hypothetical protein
LIVSLYMDTSGLVLDFPNVRCCLPSTILSNARTVETRSGEMVGCMIMVDEGRAVALQLFLSYNNLFASGGA